MVKINDTEAFAKILRLYNNKKTGVILIYVVYHYNVYQGVIALQVQLLLVLIS